MTSRVLGCIVTGSFLCLCGCEPNGSSANTGTNGTKADNTARNKVDRDSSTKTPVDQSNTSADTRITADVRRAIVDDGSLSTNAHNCKVITESGVVTLRGPVNSQAEKDAVEAKAKSVPGVASVVNQLEIKTN